MTQLTTIAPGVWGAQTRIKLGGGASLPLRMTVLRDGDGLVLVSPIAIDDALAAALADLGEVRSLLAPNLLHHGRLAAAKARYPSARVWGAPGLAAKRSDLAFDAALATGAFSPDIDAHLIEGAPKVGEIVLLHKPSRTLVVTDLVFNIREASGMSWFVLTVVSRALGRVEQSRLLRWLTSDRAASGRSIERILALPFDRVVPAHGEVIDTDARAQLRAATWWMQGHRRRPAPDAHAHAH